MSFNDKNIIFFIIKILLINILSLILFYSCANKGQGPQGGAKDVTPPRVVKSFPANNSLNFSKKSIHIQFDENISLEKLNDNVVISPPQKKTPEINAYGKDLYINFLDTMIPNTTYSIDFGESIVDLNEKNVLKNFVFSFSTGNEIDTLQISGSILDASNLNPVSGIIAGIYSASDNDSAFITKPFMRIGRSNSDGKFRISNMKSGDYRLFGLGDVSRDYYFQPGEGLALYDSIITPSVVPAVFNDTIWKDSLTVDTIKQRNGFRYLPDSIVLQYFKENKKRQYLIKNERKAQNHFTVFFNAKADSLPHIKPLNFDWKNNYIVQKNNTLDTLTYWLTDSLVWNADTLKMQVKYMKTDSAFNLVSQTDTINSIFRRPRVSARAKQKSTAIPPLNVLTNIQGVFEVYNPIKVKFDEPIENIDLTKIKLQEKIDTIFKDLKYDWQPVDSTKMSYSLAYKWEPEKSYQLAIDSAAITSIYGKANNKITSPFKIRSLEEYSSLRLIISPFQENVMLQVLDTKDAVLRTLPAKSDGALFQYLMPGDYYVRMFIDENRNGVWDTGSLSPRRKPEQVYYYNKKLSLMANWDFEETWNGWGSELLTKQKPAELIKTTNTNKQDR